MAPSPKKMQAPESWAGVTTVMFRNIPSRYTQQSLLVEIRQAGFSPDYFYLPMDFKKNANAGYAFLNFGSEQEVTGFRERFEGARLVIRSAKVLQVVPAALQGYEANYAHMAHSAVLNHHMPEHGPLFLREQQDAAVQLLYTVPAVREVHEEGLYCLRDLPQLYTHELVALELLHHGCGHCVAFLDVPLEAQSQLNQGYALVRFTDAASAQRAVQALQGADFSLAPAALPMSISPVGLPGAHPSPHVFEYAAPEPENAAPEQHELERMLVELVQMQQQVAQLPDRFVGLGIAVDEKPAKMGFAPLTASTACSDSSPRVALEELGTPAKARSLAVTPPTRSTSCSSAGSSPRLPVALEWVPDAPFALPCLLPSPASCRAIAQGF